MVSKNDKLFRNPAWVVLILGFVFDFVTVISGKYVSFTFKDYGQFPLFTSGGIVIFLVLNLIPQIKKYLATKASGQSSQPPKSDSDT